MIVFGKLLSGEKISVEINTDVSGAEFKALVKSKLGDKFFLGGDVGVIGSGRRLKDTDEVVINEREGVSEPIPYFQIDGTNYHLSGVGFYALKVPTQVSSVGMFSHSNSDTDASTKESDVPNAGKGPI